MFAIMNIKTKQFVYGTDYRHHPRHQRTSCDEMIIFANLNMAISDFWSRGCGKDYRIVKLKPIEVEEVLSDDVVEEYKRDFMKSYGFRMEVNHGE